jgi:hypothetical protein
MEVELQERRGDPIEEYRKGRRDRSIIFVLNVEALVID